MNHLKQQEDCESSKINPEPNNDAINHPSSLHKKDITDPISLKSECSESSVNTWISDTYDIYMK